MRTVVLRGLAMRKLRSVLTGLAIVLGVAMISGTFVLTDQIRGAFNDLFLQGNKGIATVVKPREAFADMTGLTTAPELPQTLIGRITSVPGVAGVAGERDDQGLLVVDGKAITPVAGYPALVISATPGVGTGTTVERGRWPRAVNEVAVPDALAKSHHLFLGQEAALATATGLKAVVITGIVKFPASVGGSVFVMDTLAASQRWFDKPGLVSRIVVSARPGVSDEQLTGRVRAALAGRSATVLTGIQDAKDNAKDINDALGKILTPALLVFGLIAMFVGAFIIFNTFTITVAQRVRELALLGSLGATPGQLRRGVLAEAAVIGVGASVLGVFAGFGIAVGMAGLFDLVGYGLPTRTPSMSAGGALQALLVGLVVTLAASAAPARRAMRVPPIVALHEGATMPPGRLARWSWLFALLLALGGGAAIVGGFSSGVAPSQRLAAIGLGALLVFLAAAALGKYIVSPVARAVGWPLERLAGITGRMARENTTRNRSRTAITAAALMVGLALVVFVSVLAEGLKTSIRDAAHGSLRADVVVQSSTFSRLPAGTLPTVRATDGISLATGIYVEEARDQHNRSVQLAGVEPTQLSQLFKFDWKQGTAQAFLSLGAHDAAVDANTATARGWKLGDRIVMRSRVGHVVPFTIRAIFDSEQGAMTGFFVSLAGYRQLVSTTVLEPIQILAKSSQGVAASIAATRLDQALTAQYPLAEARTLDEFIGNIEKQLNTIVYLFYALLSVSVLISLFGIVNTLVLSIFERTREIGMLQAIGQTQWQLRWMIVDESVITAVIGTVMGVIAGLMLAFLISLGLRDQGVTFSVPLIQLVTLVVLAVLAGMLAAIFPARRAARLDVLEALHYE